MSLLEGIDYAWERPDPHALHAAGKRFVCRYLAYDGTRGYAANGKVLHADELARLHAAGLGVVLNWEQSAGDMLKGYALGVAHAREALRQANALGAPADIPIYFSCDTAATDATGLKAVAAYLDGTAAVLGKTRAGVYGSALILDQMVPNHAWWGWQTYGWSAGRRSPKANFYQYRNGVKVAGNNVDLNVQVTPQFGAWWPIAAAQQQQPQQQGDPEMFIASHAGAMVLTDGIWYRWITAAEYSELAVVYGTARTVAHIETLGQLIGQAPQTNPAWKGATLDTFDAADLLAVTAAAQSGAGAGVAGAVEDLITRVVAGVQRAEGDFTPAQVEQVEQAVRDAFAGGLAADADAPGA